MPKLTLLTVYRVLFNRRMEKGKLWNCGTEICSNRGWWGSRGVHCKVGACFASRSTAVQVPVEAFIDEPLCNSRYNVLHPFSFLCLRSVSLEVALGGMFNSGWSLASPRVSGQGPWYAVTHRWQLELSGVRS
jgi:hypothetical protein